MILHSAATLHRIPPVRGRVIHVRRLVMYHGKYAITIYVVCCRYLRYLFYMTPMQDCHTRKTNCIYVDYIKQTDEIRQCKHKMARYRIQYHNTFMRLSWHGNVFHITDPLWRDSFGHRWIPWQRSVFRTGSDNGLLPDGTKPLPEPMPNYCQLLH